MIREGNTLTNKNKQEEYIIVSENWQRERLEARNSQIIFPM
jgi:hypothetical protein